MKSPLFSQTWGKSGPDLVILHGLFGSSDNWASIAKKLSSSYTVWGLDLRNHGQSFHHPIMTYPEMAKDVYETLSDLQIQPAAVLGHSMGGKVALQIATDYPEIVDRLVVVDIAPIDYPRTHDPLFKAMLEVEFRQIQTRTDLDSWLSNDIPSDPVRQFLIKNAIRDESGWRWKFGLMELFDQYDEILKAPKLNQIFQKPSLCIWGENSPYLSQDALTRFTAWCTNLQSVEIKNAGHWVHAEQPEVLISALNAFLGPNSGEAAR